MPRKTQIWNYFSVVDDRGKKAECNYCNKMLSYKSTTSNLNQHLKKVHLVVYEEICKDSSISMDVNATDTRILDCGASAGAVSKKKRRGKMWDYFSIVDGSDKKAVCNYCKKMLSFKTTTSNLKNHLKLKHLKICRDSSSSRNVKATNTRILSGGAVSKIKQKGQMWNYFSVVDVSAKKAQCNFCKKLLSYKTTVSNLRNHLNLKHLKICRDVSSSRNVNATDVRILDYGAAADAVTPHDEIDGGDATGSGSVISHTHPGHSTSTHNHAIVSNLSRHLSTHERTKLDKLLLNMITIDCQPFNIVDDEGFKAFVYGLNPNYELPSRKMITTILSREYEERLATIKSLVLAECTSMCITVDIWTSTTMEPYMAITGHFINKTTLDFKSILIQCSLLDGTHTGENIARAITAAVQEWNLEGKINFFVTNNAPSMNSAANLLGYPHFGCYAHTLNLVAQNALTLPEIDSTVEKIRKIVAYFKRSSEAKEKLINYQIDSQGIADESTLTLIKSVPTCWNSTFLMLQRFIQLQEAIRAIMPYLNVDLPVMPLQEWKSLEQFCEVLKPLYEATVIMSAENYLMASKAIVITRGLFNMYDIMSTNSTYYVSVQKVANNINANLKHRFANIAQNTQIAVCTFLDPRFKQFAFDNDKLMTTKSYIIEQICSEIGEEQSETNLNQETCEPSLSLWNVIDQKISASQQPSSTNTKVTDEVDMYLKQSVISRESCPLEWWRGHKTFYPYLFLIFVNYFNIIVTSVSCERAFTKAGHIINDRRNRLTSSKVAKLMFLHGNKNF